MKRIHKIAAIFLCLSLMLTLCACEKTEPYLHEVDMGGYSIEMCSLDYVLSDYLDSKETIWYTFSHHEGKDTKIQGIFVMEPDGTMYVSQTDLTLGELARMEDKEIAAMVKESYIALFEETEEDLELMRYELAIDTESTGRYTNAVILAMEIGGVIMDMVLTYEYPVQNGGEVTSNCHTVVYDSLYGGYLSDGLYFYTRVDSKVHFMLDQMGSSDLPYDVDPETLFE